MSEFIIHSVPGSPFGRSVLTALEEKGASCRLVPLGPGASKSPEHLARSSQPGVHINRGDH